MIDRKFIRSFLVVFILIFLSHVGFNYLLPKASIDFTKLLKINIFIFIITAIVIVLTYLVNEKLKEKVGFAYLALVLLKMVASILFLFPVFAEKTFQTKIYILHFFAIFLIYLAIEVVFILKKIKI